MSVSDPPVRPDGVRGTLGAVVALARQAVPAAAAVSVTVVTDAGALTAASTSAWAETLDQAQYDAAAGPCLDAAIGGEPRSIPDVRLDTRWPAYAAAAIEGGALSSLSVPVPVDDAVVASMNAYATEPHAFTDDDSTRLLRLAAVAATALATATDPPLRSRAVVDQAKGILMHQHACTAGEALDRLAEIATANGQSLREAAVVLTAATTG
jgi:hypothetical protein